jgi:hypothetical protein
MIKLTTKRQIVVATLNPPILGLADQQMVTGLAVLSAVLHEWTTMSSYHYNVAVSIA